MANYYKETLEAIGMIGRFQSIRNKLNKVHAHTDDSELKDMVKEIIHQLDRTSTDHTSIKEMNSVNTIKLESYCNEKAYG